VCWGYNTYGQCTVPAGLATVTQLAMGTYHTGAVKGDGTVVCWGWNDYGQCNVPAGLANVTQLAMGQSHTGAVKGDGSVVCWGNNYNGQCNVPAGLATVTQLAMGGGHTGVYIPTPLEICTETVAVLEAENAALTKAIANLTAQIAVLNFGDLNQDGVVDGADLTILFANWGITTGG
ncbi:MAG: hypothetical protein O2800_07885, partial [Planctomycetota bacterium]|nr:hypothetical protein [Planctomycetota bacterium]